MKKVGQNREKDLNKSQDQKDSEVAVNIIQSYQQAKLTHLTENMTKEG